MSAAVSHHTSREDAPAFWQVDILWLLLATGAQTAGQFALLEELCPRDSGPPPHTHAQDEAIYVLEGGVTFTVDGQTLRVAAGGFVTIPRGTVHSFRVESETARLLNLYVPAGFERVVTELGVPAKTRTLPPPGLPMADVGRQRMAALFAEVGMKPVGPPPTPA